MGPIALFDKSFLQMLNVDEAVVFDALYSAVICPIFYTEVLADLAKESQGYRSVERVVADLVKKTPIMHSTPNQLHSTICLTELSGHPIEMGRVPVRAGGRAVRNPEGEVGIIFDESPEAKAFDRWQSGRFHEVERDFAARYRELLSTFDHGATAKLAKQMLSIQDTPRNLEEALAIARDVVHGAGQRFLTLKTAYSLLGLPQRQFREIHERWARLGRPQLTEFAPYVAHCLLVDVFFHIAVDKKLISPDRSSNRIDIAYLYYLPFTMMFISNDKLHRRVAPLFLREDQMFVGGDELKRDLGALDAYFWSRPEEERRQGLFRLAGYPPDEDRYLTTRIWQQFNMRIRRAEENSNSVESMSRLAKDDVLAMVRQMQAAAKRADVGRFTRDEIDGAEHMVIERRIPLQRGKWKLLPGTGDDSAD